mgnify:CR=1 FL=1|jgi:hypothetical protein
MKAKKIILSAFILLVSVSCTDLSETLYDQVGSDNYYNTQMDIVRAVYRPFEHAYWSVQPRQVIQELPADLIATWKKDDWWEDGGRWSRLHYHTWTIEEELFKTEWEACFQGIMQCNYLMDDLTKLDPQKFDLTQEDFDALVSQCKTLRAWFYLRLLDEFRNVPLAVSSDVSKNSEKNVNPETLFEFIETELIECVADLPIKLGAGGNGLNQGQWTKASAAALLVRLYLNAEVYIGKPKYTECATYAQSILDGDYGSYSLEATWDKVFDWDNENSPEILFGFPSSKGYNHYVYAGDTFWWTVPARQVSYYFGDVKGMSLNGDHNCKYRLAPSLAPDGTPYTTELGRPVAKFKKYPDDYRLKMYKNLGNSTREGMMLFGYLEYSEGGSIRRVTSPEGGYDLYLRDAVGLFKGIAPNEIPADLTSDMSHGDHNSGWGYIKYPFYTDEDEGQLEADWAEIRLPEIYYSLAECKFRAGQVEDAGSLLNNVRKRNYPVASVPTYLYQPDGPVVLDEKELLDEWGREFLSESRRRIDLIRFGKFCTGTWWDKTPDADNHTIIFPLHRDVLNANPKLDQNEGYPRPE